MTSQIGKQIITTHIIPNISRSKGNKAIKFVQLTETQEKHVLSKVI